MTAQVATAEVEADAVFDGYRRHVGRAFAGLFGGGVEVKGSGAYIDDSTGRRYLDCAGFAVFLIGHGHATVVEAVVDQIKRQPLVSGMMLNPLRAEASAALAAVAPEGLEYVCFTNSGAEAVEVAIKLGRLNGCKRVVSMEGAFHGTTMAALSLAGNPLYGERFAPLLPGVQRVPFGDAEALDRELERDPGKACVILEPLQGEGGVVLPPPGYLKAVERSCAAHGAVLVFDEIQCGLGRAGAWWQGELEGATPDLLLTGKTLSGGVVPVAALIARAEVYEPLNRDPFLHTTTFGGSPIQCAAARATLGVLEDERVPERAHELGERLLPLVRDALAASCPHLVRDVRGRGLLIGIEFDSLPLAGDFFVEMLDENVVTLPCSTRKNVVRLTPPATLEETHLEQIRHALSKAGERMTERHDRLGAL